jgi:hypothetical protein
MYSIAPSQDFHPLGLFKNNHSEEFNFLTLFYGHPQSLTIFFKLSYQQIAPWELFHKSQDLPLKFLSKKL